MRQRKQSRGGRDEDALDSGRLRAWLCMVRVTRGVGAELRERLRIGFDATLPQFDVLSALYSNAKGMRMGALSDALMVSNGNVTGIVERLVEQGYVVRAPVEGDRRATLVRLTRKGRESFERMAAHHRAWVSEALGGLDDGDASELVELLKAARSGGSRR